MLREEAEQTARREFGNVTLIEERSRELWQWARVESIAADLKFVLRRLRKSPGFATTVLLTLAIGIGANTAVFTVLNSVIFEAAALFRSRSIGELVAERARRRGIDELHRMGCSFLLRCTSLLPIRIGPFNR